MTTKNKYFVMISNDLVRSGKFPPYELAVYLNLKSRRGNKQSAYPSHATIAKETAMSVTREGARASPQVYGFDCKLLHRGEFN